MDSTITYYFSRRVLLTPLAAIGLPGIFICSTFFIDMPTILGIIIIAGSIFLLFGLAISNFHLPLYFLTRKPAIIISKSSLIDNINKQTYNWSDISDITFHDKSRLIWINIGDRYKDKYSNSKNWLTKFYLKFHLDLTHGSFWVNPKTVDDKAGQLLDNLVKYHHWTLDQIKTTPNSG